MPLPDERPRQSVANLIGRFETQTKRLSLSASSPSRSSSVVSHITGESNGEGVREKREWPPRSVLSTEKPPLILPSLSSRNLPPSLVTQSSSNGSELGTTDSWKKDAADEPEVPLTAKALNASQRQSKAEPNTFLENWRKDIPSTQVGLEPEAPTTATLQTEPQVDATTPIPSATQKFNNPTTPRTSSVSKATIRMPASKTSSSTKTPPSSSAKAIAVSSKAPAKTPVKTPVPKQPATPVAQPLKPQHTGQSVASIATTKRPAIKVPATPISKTPSRTEASRAKTPTSARPKTPSTGLFAPTAASLARSRNAAPQLPTPSKKTTISSSSMDRLSKPTAASKARVAVSASAPAARSGGTVTPRQSTSGKARTTPASSPSKVKKAPTPKPAATGAAVVAAIAAVGLAATAVAADGNDKTVEDLVDNIHKEAHDDSPAEEVCEPTEEGTETHELEEAQGEGREGSPSVGSGELETTPKSPSPAPEASDVLEDDEEAGHNLEVVEDEAHQATAEVHEAKDELEDIVNLLESTSITKSLNEDTTAPTDIPDEILEIPDEHDK